MSSEMKPCPFCGNKAMYRESESEAGFIGACPFELKIECINCDAEQSVCGDYRKANLNELKQKVIDKWNTRKQLEAKGGWVSVKERLPERFQSVAFVVKSEDEKYHRKVYGGRFQGIMFEGESCEYPGFSVPGIEFEGSHWQPLPPPPEAE